MSRISKHQRALLSSLADAGGRKLTHVSRRTLLAVVEKGLVEVAREDDDGRVELVLTDMGRRVLGARRGQPTKPAAERVSETVAVRLRPETVADLKARAEAAGLSLTRYVRQLLESHAST